jgi:hypothetical protein
MKCKRVQFSSTGATLLSIFSNDKYSIIHLPHQISVTFLFVHNLLSKLQSVSKVLGQMPQNLWISTNNNPPPLFNVVSHFSSGLMCFGLNNIRELKHVGRQHDDDGQNKFLQINYSKENLSYIIIRMNLIQYKKLKTLALCLGRVLLTEF